MILSLIILYRCLHPFKYKLTNFLNTNNIIILINLIPGYRLTVRTLVFHTNNVGSIPTGLIMKINNLVSLNTINKLVEHSNPISLYNHPKVMHQTLPNLISNNLFIRHEFRFVSLIPPHIPSFIHSQNSLL